MSDDTGNEDQISQLRSALEALTQREGIWRPDLMELLAGRLHILCEKWRIDLDNSPPVVREALATHLAAQIKQLEPRGARQQLALEQRRAQYAQTLFASFNILPSPELRGLGLGGRRRWLDSDARRSLKIAPSTAKRDLEHAIEQIARSLASGAVERADAGADGVYPSLSTNGVEEPADVEIATVAFPDLRPGVESPNNSDTSVHAAGPEGAQPSRISGVELADTRDVARPARGGKGKAGLTVLAVAVVGVLAAGLVVWSPWKSSSSGVTSSSQSSPSSTAAAPSAAANGCTDALCLTTMSWPRFRGCDGATSVAMSPGGPDFNAFASASDTGKDLADASAGGASWKEGHLQLLLGGVDERPTVIQDIRKSKIERLPAGPKWVYTPQGGCGDTYERVFNLNLDKGTVVDAGRVGSPEAATSTPKAEPLGRSFYVTKSEPAEVRVDALSCHGNYKWSLDVLYGRPGETPKVYTVGPFLSMGQSEKTSFYTDSAGPGTPPQLTSSAPNDSMCR